MTIWIGSDLLATLSKDSVSGATKLRQLPDTLSVGGNIVVTGDNIPFITSASLSKLLKNKMAMILLFPNDCLMMDTTDMYFFINETIDVAKKFGAVASQFVFVTLFDPIRSVGLERQCVSMFAGGTGVCIANGTDLVELCKHIEWHLGNSAPNKNDIFHNDFLQLTNLK